MKDDGMTDCCYINFGCKTHNTKENKTIHVMNLLTSGLFTDNTMWTN